MSSVSPQASARQLFEYLIAPITAEEFFRDYWEQKVLYIPRNDPAYYDSILTFGDVDEYLSRTDLRYPYIRLVQQGRELPLNTYAYDSVFGENLFQGNLNLDKLFQLYRDGATMCMQLQHLALPSLRSFTNHIEQFFQFRTQSTLFLTPPQSQGFTAHFDSHDFFIFQIYGQKQWLIYPDAVEFPLARNRVLDSEVEVSSAPSFQPLIQPGDCLYVPRGIFHEALTNEGTSLQISLGVFPYIWCDVLHKMIDDLAGAIPSLRKASLSPIGSDSSKLQAEFSSLLDQLRIHGSPDASIADMKRKALAHQSKECRGRLTDLERLPGLSLDARLVKRDVHTLLDDDGERITLFFYDKEIDLPSSVRPELDFVLSGAEFSTASMPGSLDPGSRMLLAETLITEGLIRFV
jgi:ribosomal protein L16 Arg81 hydroxylase